jgi:hypothetical protein
LSEITLAKPVRGLFREIVRSPLSSSSSNRISSLVNSMWAPWLQATILY